MPHIQSHVPQLEGAVSGRGRNLVLMYFGPREVVQAVLRVEPSQYNGAGDLASAS